MLVFGAIARKPMVRVPENTLKFGVRVVPSAFGVFRTGEGLGVAWPGHDLALFIFAARMITSTGLPALRGGAFLRLSYLAVLMLCVKRESVKRAAQPRQKS